MDKYQLINNQLIEQRKRDREIEKKKKQRKREKEKQRDREKKRQVTYSISSLRKLSKNDIQQQNNFFQRRGTD